MIIAAQLDWHPSVRHTQIVRATCITSLLHCMAHLILLANWSVAMGASFVVPSATDHTENSPHFIGRVRTGEADQFWTRLFAPSSLSQTPVLGPRLAYTIHMHVRVVSVKQPTAP